MQANISSQSPLLSVRLGLILAATVLGLGLAAGVVANVQALTLCVNPGGTGGCYSKIQLAVNAASPGDTIIVAAGTYTENVTIGISVTVNGAGSGLTFVDGNSAGSVFTIGAGTTAVTLTNMTIRDGYANSGGGINCRGKLTLTNVIIINNTAVYNGGGVYELTLGPLLTFNSSTVSNNTAGLGGGIYDDSSPFSMVNSTVGGNQALTGGGGGILIAGGYVTVTNGTISSNTAKGNGGGVYNSGNRSFTALDSTISGNIAISTTTASGDGGGLYNTGAALVNFNNVTVANNHAGAAGHGGGVFNGNVLNASSVSVYNTIIGTNTAPIGMDCSGTLNSQGYNLIQIAAGCTIVGNLSGNILGPNPMLGPLANNGGPTWTQALLGGSPAINAGNPAPPGSGGTSCLPTDQRGHARGATRCDMGAYEYP